MNDHNNHHDAFNKPSYEDWRANDLALSQYSADQLSDFDRERLKHLCQRYLNSQEPPMLTPSLAEEYYWLITYRSHLIASVRYQPIAASPIEVTSSSTSNSRPPTSGSDPYFVGQLRQLVVAKDFQRQGLGRMLVKHLEGELIRQAQKVSKSAICLLHARQGATDFYQRLGYRVCDKGLPLVLLAQHRHKLQLGQSPNTHYQWLYRCLCQPYRELRIRHRNQQRNTLEDADAR